MVSSILHSLIKLNTMNINVLDKIGVENEEDFFGPQALYVGNACSAGRC
jgi:hypothetical protein